MATSPSKRARITPPPTQEEAVAIVAAYEALWPRPVLGAEPVPVVAAPKWRFSGRWWSRPVAARRIRPW